MNEIITADRSLEQVTDRIRALTALSFSNACQIGKLLIDAKPMVKHGEWEKYLADLGYKPSSANNLMLMCERYGEFGEKLQTFGNFSPSQAIALFGLPDGERESFLEAHPDAESMSVRKLKQQIAAEKKRANDAEVSTSSLREQLAVAQEEIGAAHQKAENWMHQSHDWQDKAAEGKKVEARLRGDISALEKDLAAAKAQAGRVDPAELARIRDEARTDAERIVAESHNKELAAKDDTIEKLQAELQQLQKAAARGEEQKALISIIQAAVWQVGEKLNVLQGHYLKVKGSNPQLAEAIRSLVARQINMMHDRFDIEPV